MQDTITTIYCLCDDFLQAMNHRDDPQTQVSSAEVMSVSLVAACYFGGKVERAQEFLHEHGYLPKRLSKSRLNRRLHALPLSLWRSLFELLGLLFKQNNPDHAYTVDSMPIPACDNIRIKRCRLFPGEEHRGYTASKRRYFFGLKVHLLITGSGHPVEFVLTPGNAADVSTFKELPLDLESGAIIYGDRAYTDYAEEDLLQEAAGITLRAQRKKNSKRPLPLCLEFLGKPIRQRVETTFSQFEALLPRHIHAVTSRGFTLKVICFLLAVSISYFQR